MRLYADAAALAAYPGGSAVPTESVDALLRTASRTVDTLLRAVPYDTDTAGMPTDTDVAQAMSDAACAIAVEANAAGVLDPGGGGEWASVSIGNVSLSNPTDSTPRVGGVPVPVAAVQALQSIGRPVVAMDSGGYVRPLDRITP